MVKRIQAVEHGHPRAAHCDRCAKPKVNGGRCSCDEVDFLAVSTFSGFTPSSDQLINNIIDVDELQKHLATAFT
jgi:hypothetical protein